MSSSLDVLRDTLGLTERLDQKETEKMFSPLLASALHKSIDEKVTTKTSANVLAGSSEVEDAEDTIVVGEGRIAGRMYMTSEESDMLDFAQVDNFVDEEDVTTKEEMRWKPTWLTEEVQRIHRDVKNRLPTCDESSSEEDEREEDEKHSDDDDDFIDSRRKLKKRSKCYGG